MGENARDGHGAKGRRTSFFFSFFLSLSLCLGELCAAKGYKRGRSNEKRRTATAAAAERAAQERHSIGGHNLARVSRVGHAFFTPWRKRRPRPLRLRRLPLSTRPAGRLETLIPPISFLFVSSLLATANHSRILRESWDQKDSAVSNFHKLGLVMDANADLAGDHYRRRLHGGLTTSREFSTDAPDAPKIIKGALAAAQRRSKRRAARRRECCPRDVAAPQPAATFQQDSAPILY